jgi:uncharacterized membrane protein YdjX (TVP38/TMEM64 family)
LRAKLAGIFTELSSKSQPKMTKKGSIFNTLLAYLRTHPGATVGWFWVTVMPGLGSLLLVSNSDWAKLLNPEQLVDQLVFIFLVAMLLGFALLPTTLTAIATGYFYGWLGLPGLFLGYVIANWIGYSLGRRLNMDFFPILYEKSPSLKTELHRRINHPQPLIFFIRISPVIPFAISNYLFASFRIPFQQVLWYGIPGMLPRTLIAFGTGLLANSFTDAKKAMNEPIQWAILGILFMVSFWGLYANWKKSKT